MTDENTKTKELTVQTPTLNAENRAAALDEMCDEQGLDLLVIGGGVTGAGVVLDAATRGLRVGIIEAQDWSSGTSSRSSKLVHGGLRYLQMLDFKLVAEALRERELLLHTTAPHLVKPVPFFYPVLHRFWERPYVTAGIGLYDFMSWAGSKVHAMPFHRHYTLGGVKRAFPDMADDAMVGAVKYWDGKVDDSRLVLGLVRTAVSLGALAASRTALTDFLKDGTGRVIGAKITDLETGKAREIRAKAVINSCGVWTEEVQAKAGPGGLKVLASKGIHIVVPRDRLQGQVGFILQTEKSVLFIIPWKHYWIIGTTDTKYEKDLRNPVASAEDIDYVLEKANVVLKKPLTRDDIIGSFAGLRPLLQPGTIDGDKAKSTKVSREHTVTQAAPGLTVIAGGKLTTYRVMAQDAVDFALGAKTAKRLPSATPATPLVGAVGYKSVLRARARIAAKYGWSPSRVEDLADRYGSEVYTLTAMVDADPQLGKPLGGGADQYLRAEVAFGIRYEGALHLEDLLLHRTRLVYETADRGLAAIEEIADIAAAELGWDDQKRAKEVKSYRSICDSQAAASLAKDEDAAQKERAKAKDITPMA